MLADHLNSASQYFLKSLEKIASKNNGTFEVDINIQDNALNVILQEIEENSIKIDILSTKLDYENFQESFESIGNTIKGIKWLAIKHFGQFLPFFNVINLGNIRKKHPNCFPLLEAIEIKSDGWSYLTDVNEFLDSGIVLQWAKKDGLFVTCNLQAHCVRNDFDYDYGINSNQDDNQDQDNINLFGVLCNIVYSLLIEKMVPMDISITLITMNKLCNKTEAQDIFRQNFNQGKILKEYNAPVLNEKQQKYCQSLINPIVTLVNCDEHGYIFVLRVANARVVWKENAVKGM